MVVVAGQTPADVLPPWLRVEGLKQTVLRGGIVGRLNLPVTGTAGVLLVARRRALIHLVQPCLDALVVGILLKRAGAHEGLRPASEEGRQRLGAV